MTIRVRVSAIVAALVLGCGLISVPAGASVPRPADCVSAPTGLVPVTITSGGISRTFLAYVPKRRTGPVLVNLHSSSGTGAQQLEYSRLRTTADRFGFVIVAPDGALPLEGGHAWHIPGVPLADGSFPPPDAPDDVRYVSDVIDTVHARWCTDRGRVYATGFSGGARMSSLLGCELAGKIAAIAPVSGLRAGRPGPDGQPDPATCRPDRPMPVFAIHGTGDTVNPYDDGGPPHWRYGVLAALGRWAAVNRCASDLKTLPVNDVLTLLAYSKCRGGANVELLRITAGGHQWPGSPGEVDPGLDVNTAMWLALSRYRR